VIRAVVRKGAGRAGATSSSATGTAGAVRLRTIGAPLGVPEVARHPASRWARSSAPRGPTRFALDDGPDRIAANIEAAGVDGADRDRRQRDTLGRRFRALHSEARALNVVGVPKTIDNDPLRHRLHLRLRQTAINIADGRRSDRLHTTADSHHRVLIVEVMGRHGGMDRGPCRPRGRRQRDPDPGARVRRRRGLPDRRRSLRQPLRADHRRSPRERNPSAGMAGSRGGQNRRLRPRAPRRGRPTGWRVRSSGSPAKRTRATVLGHVQRGGTPTAFDRVLGDPPSGLHAIDAAKRRPLGDDGRRCEAPTSSWSKLTEANGRS